MKSILIIATIILSACSSSIPNPSQNDSELKEKNVSIDELRGDRQIYIHKCAGCHSLYIPSQFTEQEWSVILSTMKEKSKINNEEIERIKRYLSVYAAKSHIQK